MPKDRDQLTPVEAAGSGGRMEPEDAEHLASHRGQGTGGTGCDLLAEEADVEAGDAGDDPAE